ncbi:MAG: hypothetical protein ACFHVJ_12970 [Aestuariibacter sp.]
MNKSIKRLLTEKDLDNVVGGVTTYPEGTIVWRDGFPWLYEDGRWIPMRRDSPGKPDDKE